MNRRPPRSILYVAGLAALLVAAVGISSARASLFPICGASAAPRVNWSLCDKTGYHSSQGGDLTGATLKATKLDYAKFYRSKLVGVTAELATFNYAVIHDTPMRDSRFTLAGFRHAELIGDDAARSDWLDANLTNAFIQETNFSYGDFSKAIVAGATLRAVSLDHANLYGAKLDGANLLGTSLRNASLQRAQLVDVLMSAFGSDHPLVDLTGANLTAAVVQLRAGDWWPHIRFSNTICPDGTNSDHDAGKTCRGHGFK